MLDRLGFAGTVAALTLVACAAAAVYQKSIVAMVVGVAAAIYLGLRLFRPASA